MLTLDRSVPEAVISEDEEVCAISMLLFTSCCTFLETRGDSHMKKQGMLVGKIEFTCNSYLRETSVDVTWTSLDP